MVHNFENDFCQFVNVSVSRFSWLDKIYFVESSFENIRQMIIFNWSNAQATIHYPFPKEIFHLLVVILKGIILFTQQLHSPLCSNVQLASSKFKWPH